MTYVVEVVPPEGAPFEVDEPDWGRACARARRYREHGWGAAVSTSSETVRWWRVSGGVLPPYFVKARSVDSALQRARRRDPGYCAVQAFER